MDYTFSSSNPAEKKSKVPPSAGKTANDVTEKIKELYLEMPKEIFEDSKDATISGKLKAKTPSDKIPNKGHILSEAVNYLTQLQNEVDSANRKEVEIKNNIREMLYQLDQKNIPYSDILQDVGIKDSNILSSFNSSSTTAELLLYELMDIGPLANENNTSVSDIQQSATPHIGTTYTTAESSSMNYDPDHMRSGTENSNFSKLGL